MLRTTYYKNGCSHKCFFWIKDGNIVTNGFGKIFFFLLLFTIALSHNANAENQSSTSTEYSSVRSENPEKEYNPGLMLLEHIKDNHSWHIMDIGNLSISFPLPVILFHNKTWYFFMSSKFNHGHTSYKNFMIAHEGSNKGKIVKTLPNSTIEDANASLPIDLSITKNVVAALFSAIFICYIFIFIAQRYKKNSLSSPKGIQSLLEPLILLVLNDIAKNNIPQKKYLKYTPFLLTVFFFIFFNNLLGLIPIAPGGANLTGNIAVTLVLSMFTFVITNIYAPKSYWGHIFNTPNVPWFLKLPIPLMPIIEFIGVFTKPFALMIRLFANITAGHIVLLGFVSLIFIFGKINPSAGFVITPFSVLLGIFISLLELLVAFIQAYVFTLLSAIFFGMSQEESH